jgi:hypothetical protein
MANRHTNPWRIQVVSCGFVTRPVKSGVSNSYNHGRPNEPLGYDLLQTVTWTHSFNGWQTQPHRGQKDFEQAIFLVI